MTHSTGITPPADVRLAPTGLSAAKDVRDSVVRWPGACAPSASRTASARPGSRSWPGCTAAVRATAKALADAEDTQPQTLTRVLAALDEQGLIAARAIPTDGRQVLLDITDDGLAVLQQHAATQFAWLARAMDETLPKRSGRSSGWRPVSSTGWPITGTDQRRGAARTSSR